MTDEQKKIINEMFRRYGSISDNTEITCRNYLVRPDTIDDLEKVQHYDKSAEEAIGRMTKIIENLKIYRIALYEQYNYLKTVQVEKIVKLKREKKYSDNHVYYYLMEIEKNVDNQKERIINSVKYSGTERKKAFEDFQKYKKSHPGITAIQDTKKGRWEK